MFTRPDDLPDSSVVEGLERGWGLRASEIEYAPVGFGSHHWQVAADDEAWFVTVDDLEARKRDPAETLDEGLARLSAALSTARRLRNAGMAFVVAPLRTRAGSIVHTLDERFAVALYPHVGGDSHPWEPYPARADRLAVLDLIAAVHRAPATACEAALTDDFVIPSRAALLAGLSDRWAGPWAHGPFSEPARVLLDHHAPAVRRAVERYDSLAALVASRPERMVLTHGEPHRANTITTDDRVMLVDWDTALIAPPERDLWALAAEDFRIVDDYTARTGITIDSDALQLYSLWWDLTEISLYIDQFHRPHRETEDTRAAWDNLQRYLRPARWQAANDPVPPGCGRSGRVP